LRQTDRQTYRHLETWLANSDMSCVSHKSVNLLRSKSLDRQTDRHLETWLPDSDMSCVSHKFVNLLTSKS